MSVEDIFPLAVEFRRHFHQHPEFAMQEVETQRYITEVLDKYGIVYRTVGTGVIAMIGQGEKCVAIRADMDAHVYGIGGCCCFKITVTGFERVGKGHIQTQ